MDGSRVDGPGVWWRLSKHGCSEFGWVPLVDGDRVAAHTHRHGSRRRRTAIGRAGSGDDEQAQPAECSEGGDGVVGWGEMQESGIRDKVTIASRLDGRRGWLGRPVVVVVVVVAQARASKYGESKAQDGRHASRPGLAQQQQQQQAPGLGFTYLQQQLCRRRAGRRTTSIRRSAGLERLDHRLAVSPRTTATRCPVPFVVVAVVMVVVVIVVEVDASAPYHCCWYCWCCWPKKNRRVRRPRHLMSLAVEADQGPNWLGHWLITLPYLALTNTADVRGTIPLDRKGHGHLRLFTIAGTKVPVGGLAWMRETGQASWRQRRWHAAWPTLGVEGQSSHAAPLLATTYFTYCYRYRYRYRPHASLAHSTFPLPPTTTPPCDATHPPPSLSALRLPLRYATLHYTTLHKHTPYKV
ncbi:hypothetical protein COCVIDRAFT_16626 [Bipolaris victoriae FI3]|uniref:Uncharacterized protein n=1 Tax=Bipolaris victoriae (strain FI3) TaxID=930091 RepID=W7EKA2_BIPV3|nr:hypothetical protein COCVIDRAFT_16626 [Bipolaris victoriae FI3]